MRSRLSKSEQESLFYDLIHALMEVKTAEEASLFIQDLLTKQELYNLSKRLRIAKLLLSGKTYEEIEKQVHVSHATIAKIGVWLSDRGEGFRSIVRKLPKQEVVMQEKPHEWGSIKRRYPMYFWPELLLEEIAKSASGRQRKRMQQILISLEDKSELHKRLQNILRTKV